MIKYLLKTVETYRVECMTDVTDFHEWLQEDAKRQRYTLAGFSYTEKQTKDDEWYNVKVTKVFEKEKDPDLPLKTINYETYVEEVNAEVEDMDMEEDFE